MNFSKLNYAVLAATLMTGLISAPSQAGDLRTIKAIAGVQLFDAGSSTYHKYAKIRLSTAITCGGTTSDTLRVFLGQIYYSQPQDPWFENFTNLLTAAQNNLTIEINWATPSTNSLYCETNGTGVGDVPPMLIYYQ